MEFHLLSNPEGPFHQFSNPEPESLFLSNSEAWQPKKTGPGPEPMKFSNPEQGLFILSIWKPIKQRSANQTSALQVKCIQRIEFCLFSNPEEPFHQFGNPEPESLFFEQFGGLAAENDRSRT